MCRSGLLILVSSHEVTTLSGPLFAFVFCILPHLRPLLSLYPYELIDWWWCIRHSLFISLINVHAAVAHWVCATERWHDCMGVFCHYMVGGRQFMKMFCGVAIVEGGRGV